MINMYREKKKKLLKNQTRQTSKVVYFETDVQLIDLEDTAAPRTNKQMEHIPRIGVILKKVKRKVPRPTPSTLVEFFL